MLSFAFFFVFCFLRRCALTNLPPKKNELRRGRGGGVFLRIFFLYPFSRDTLRTRWASGVGWCCLSTHVLYLYRFFFFFFLHPSPSFTRRAPTSSRLLPPGCMEGVANFGYRVTSFVNGNRWEEKKGSKNKHPELLPGYHSYGNLRNSFGRQLYEKNI